MSSFYIYFYFYFYIILFINQFLLNISVKNIPEYENMDTNKLTRTVIYGKIPLKLLHLKDSKWH
jgi:hypothetical protein